MTIRWPALFLAAILLRWPRTAEIIPQCDKTSTHPSVPSSKYGGDHVFVPFAMEDGGITLGAHALALLKQLAELFATAVARGCFSSLDNRVLLSPLPYDAGFALDAAPAAPPFYLATCHPLPAAAARLAASASLHTTMQGFSPQVLAGCFALFLVWPSPLIFSMFLAAFYCVIKSL